VKQAKNKSRQYHRASRTSQDYTQAVIQELNQDIQPGRKNGEDAVDPPMKGVNPGTRKHPSTNVDGRPGSDGAVIVKRAVNGCVFTDRKTSHNIWTGHLSSLFTL